MPKQTLLAALAAAALVAPLAAPLAAAADEMAETVAAALDRGYGTVCDLRNQPATREGYYPCLDIGPYRFVKGYGSLSAFVVMADGTPFPIYRVGEGGGGFLVRGEWQRDLAPRVAAWWADEVGGGRMRREAGETSASRLRDAEAEVMRHSPRPSEPAAAVAPVTPPPPAASAPVSAAPEPVAQAPAATSAPGGAEILRGAPIPTRIDGGREIAPGVVQLPSGRTTGR